jgi:hypothetical protein
VSPSRGEYRQQDGDKGGIEKTRYGESRAKDRLSHRIVINDEVAEQFCARVDDIGGARETPPSDGVVGEEKERYPGGAGGERQDAPATRIAISFHVMKNIASPALRRRFPRG